MDTFPNYLLRVGRKSIFGFILLLGKYVFWVVFFTHASCYFLDFTLFTLKMREARFSQLYDDYESMRQEKSQEISSYKVGLMSLFYNMDVNKV